MQIVVKTLTGKNVEVEIEESTSVLDIKGRIETLEGIPVDQQRMLFQGRTMEDHEQAEVIGLIPGSVVHLVLRLRSVCECCVLKDVLRVEDYIVEKEDEFPRWKEKFDLLKIETMKRKTGERKGRVKRRLFREIRDLYRHPHPNLVSLRICDFEKWGLTRLSIYIIGPKSSCYENQIIRFGIVFPEHYPYKPPSVIVHSKFFHPMCKIGRNVYTPHSWAPLQQLRMVITFLIHVLKTTKEMYAKETGLEGTGDFEEANYLATNDWKEFEKRARAFSSTPENSTEWNLALRNSIKGFCCEVSDEDLSERRDYACLTNFSDDRVLLIRLNEEMDLKVKRCFL